MMWLHGRAAERGSGWLGAAADVDIAGCARQTAAATAVVASKALVVERRPEKMFDNTMVKVAANRPRKEAEA